MAKSRSKNSRQPVKKSPVKKSAAARRGTKPRPAKVGTRKPAVAAARKGQWVYAFGGGKAAGRASMRNLLGGKGAGLAEMAHLGLPVPPGFTITTEVCTYFYAHDKTYPKNLKAQVEAALALVGRITGKKFGDAKNPLLVSVRSGARASMPGMMDTVLNLGLNDVTVEAVAEKSGDRRFAQDSYRRFITMYSNVVLGIEHHHFEEILDDHKDRHGYSARHRPQCRRLGRDHRPLQGARRGGERQAIPAGPARPALGRDRRRVRLVDEPSAPSPIGACTIFRKAGARRSTCRPWCSATWATTSAHWRCLHAQPFDRREEALWRVSDQCPGRGRGCRHPHAAGNHRGGAPCIRLRQAVDGKGDAGCIRRAQTHPRRAGKALPRHAGPGIHGRAGQAVDAADAQRQAHRQGCLAHCRRARQRKADHQAGGGDAHRAGLARSAPASDHRSGGRAQDYRDRLAGVARRRLRRGCVLARRGGAAQEPGPQSHSGAGRNLARRHSRHARRRRYSDNARRHDLARRRGGPRHGQAVRLRRRKLARRLPRADDDGRRYDAQEGRVAHHRRLDRPGAGRQGADDCSPRSPANSPR